jgi:hypothetical protein
VTSFARRTNSAYGTRTRYTLEAVRQWRLTPTTLNGVAVEVKMTVRVNFSLR